MDLLGEAEASVLSGIYVKQHIRESGVLYSEYDDQNGREAVRRLEVAGYVVSDRFYKFLTLRCTESGAKLASSRIREFLELQHDHLRTEMSRIPQKVCRFLVSDCLASKSSWPTEKKDYFFALDWRQFPLQDQRVWDYSLMLFSFLERESKTVPLAARTRNYVSTGGGALRDEEFTFPPETTTELSRLLIIDSGLSLDESRPFRVAQFLTDVAPYLTPESQMDVREFVWQKLSALSLKEGDIAAMINDELTKDGVCSEWKGLYTAKLPFLVFDGTALRMYVRRSLVAPGVDRLVKFDLAGQEEVQARLAGGITADVLPFSSSQGGGSELKTTIEMFREIAMLEVALRELIETRLRTAFGKEWVLQLPPAISSAWDQKRKEDEKASLEPEQDPIKYADFSDYAEILTSKKFRSLFQDKFGDIEKTKVALNEIKDGGRNRVMHLRTITDESYYTTSRWIRWTKDQLAKS